MMFGYSTGKPEHGMLPDMDGGPGLEDGKRKTEKTAQPTNRQTDQE
jgi:hypothetical protein